MKKKSIKKYKKSVWPSPRAHLGYSHPLVDCTLKLGYNSILATLFYGNILTKILPSAWEEFVLRKYKQKDSVLIGAVYRAPPDQRKNIRKN